MYVRLEDGTEIKRNPKEDTKEKRGNRTMSTLSMNREERLNKWSESADENVEKWGVQPPVHVVVAIMEELSEIAEEIIENSEPPDHRRTPEERELMYLFSEIIVLGDEIQTFWDDVAEDDEGDPVPESERPSVIGDIKNASSIQEEVDDIAPLIIQLAESVDEYSKW